MLKSENISGAMYKVTQDVLALCDILENADDLPEVTLEDYASFMRMIAKCLHQINQSMSSDDWDLMYRGAPGRDFSQVREAVISALIKLSEQR